MIVGCDPLSGFQLLLPISKYFGVLCLPSWKWKIKALRREPISHFHGGKVSSCWISYSIGLYYSTPRFFPIISRKLMHNPLISLARQQVFHGMSPHRPCFLMRQTLRCLCFFRPKKEGIEGHVQKKHHLPSIFQGFFASFHRVVLTCDRVFTHKRKQQRTNQPRTQIQVSREQSLGIPRLQPLTLFHDGSMYFPTYTIRISYM